MAVIEATTEVEAPIRTVYDQWTQFEEFPRFMDGVEEVRQFGETELHWVAEIGGARREWDAKITEQVPDQCIAWRSTGGVQLAGRVDFEPIEPARTRVRLEMEFEPEGFVEKAGEVLGVIERRAEGDLERFREFVQSGEAPTGSWRGEVHRGTPAA